SAPGFGRRRSGRRSRGCADPVRGRWWSRSGSPRDLQRIRQGEVALVERRADDRALDTDRHERPACLDVRKRGDTTARDDGTVGASADLLEKLEVRALEHAVLGDVGDDIAGAALTVEPVERLPEVAAFTGPAAGR